MGLTLIQKILLKHSLSGKLKDFIYAKVDFCFGNDITAPLAVKEFNKAGFDSVFDPNKIGLICDHFTPARDQKAANNVKLLKQFSRQFKIKHFYDIEACGVEHVFLPEAGLVKSLDLVIGADSHTCTYGALGAASFGVGSTDLAAAMKEGKCWLRVPESLKFVYQGKLNPWVGGKDLILYTIGKIGVDGALYKVMEFSGEAIRKLEMDDRFTMCNMAIEAGGKTGIIEPDEKTVQYIKTANPKLKNFKFEKSDPDAAYARVINIDVGRIKPQVACPHLPSNSKSVKECVKVKLDQVVIGSCTNGRLSDLAIAAKILRGKKIKKGLRAIVIPATPKIYDQAEKKKYLQIFSEAGFIISPATCGPCLGGHTGILDKGEVALATTNRNFIGRMGSPESFVYLSSPAVAAASAITGRITDPDEVAG
ncbi:MAG: 3-isopropylmalate dehydratase large subunit [Candidatus Omnitrophica bacterium]|nr:3-isopropylmalate dehydratase large subunit [Candidatus Omnitrophota bacterium]